MSEKKSMEAGDATGQDSNRIPDGLDWGDLNLFLAVARDGGLSAAARSTGRSAATLGRRMHELERRLGRELFVRHDRGYRMTGEGQALMAELSQVEARIARLVQPPGTDGLPLVKVSAGTWTTLALLRAFDALTGSPADVRLRFVSAERVMDIAHREVTIGFRNRPPTQEGLAGRMLSAVTFASYAAAGRAGESADTKGVHRWIRVLADTPSARWVAQTAAGNAVCEVSSPRNALDLALAGHGRALLPTFIGDAEPGLERVGPVVPELTHDQWLVAHEADRHLPEVRRSIDRMCRVLEGLGRDAGGGVD
ncbi:LysR family transcriptional regulator [Salipiger sp. 1_MG-2023]|uniref:LysR family transcriptional regulator n=1 Tax=Salipiger sp. 1_MG-2023 TaxID=3062665 RepID=UPI0026E3641D|nr:LysR family transcriptional regulator [Salipiger sp. 1_MG-2023]MDO6588246.1 LysR family transcriptional regulator [Salipiger sp. 1_MG-2023]